METKLPAVKALEAVATLIQDCGPRADKVRPGSVLVETAPLVGIGGVMIAKVFGPYASESEAENYIRVKRERHLDSTRRHFLSGGVVENDRHVWAHPELRYRIIGADGWIARYLAQIGLTAMGALVGMVTQGDENAPWIEPDDGPGLLDEDDYQGEDDDDTDPETNEDEA